MQVNWDQPTDDVGTLQGATRFRLAHPNASPSFEFEIFFTEDECETFEAWYDEVVALGGEVYLPWIGEGRILYFTQYELSPIGTGWKLHALAVQLYVDPDYVERHICTAAYAWRIPVLVDEDADYPITLCELPGAYYRPRIIDRFFSTAMNERLTDPWDTPDTFIATLTSTNVWVGNTWGHDKNPGELAMLTDTITAYLPVTTPVFVDIPANWMWDAYIEEWARDARMVYIDDWWSVWLEELVNACRVIKDTLPPPWAILDGNSMLNFAWMERIIADMFPLETYFDVEADFPLPTLSFTAAPTEVNGGEGALLTWTTGDAYVAEASGGWSGKQALSGTANTGPLWLTTSFTLAATGPGGGPVTQTVTVTVTMPMPTAIISATPSSVPGGSSSTLSWVTTNATTVTASGGWGGTLAASGSVSTGALAATKTFTITASNAMGDASASTTVTVTGPPPPLFESNVVVVAGNVPGLNQYGFFEGGPTTGGVGSVTPANLPAGGSAMGRRIRAIASQQVGVGTYDLLIMCDGAAGLTQTNQFDSVSVVDNAGVTRTFTSAGASTFGNDPIGYASWWWEGNNMVMRTAGRAYTFTFRKVS